METLGAIYVVLSSLFGTAVISLCALLWVLEIAQSVKERREINKMDKSFAASNRP